MATTFIEGIAVRPGRTPLITARDSIAYITNPEKTQNRKLVSSFRCSPESAHFEIMMEQHEFEQQTGRKVTQDYKEKKQSYMLMTMRQSFAPDEVTPEQAHEIGCKLAQRFLGDKYQYVVATHINSHCIHNHITFNIVGSDLKKYHQTKYTHRHLADISDKLCEEYGLVVVIPSPEWQERKYTNENHTPYRTILKSDIDSAVEAAKSYDEFLKIMEGNYRIDTCNKYLKFRHRTNGQQRFLRSYTLGKEYSEQSIRERVAGRKIQNNVVSDELIQPLSYSQHLRNITTMIDADRFISENGSDFIAQFDSVSLKSEEVQKQISAAQMELSKVKSIKKCFDAVEKYGDIASEYNTSLLKERFVQSHKDELEFYNVAIETLHKNNIDVNPVSNQQFTANLFELENQLADLQTQYDAAQAQLKQVNLVKKVIDKIHNGDQIITEKKGGSRHGR